MAKSKTSKTLAAIGGLTDEDAFATRPPITSKTKPAAKKAGSKGILTRDFSRTNSVCIPPLVVVLVLIPLVACCA